MLQLPPEAFVRERHQETLIWSPVAYGKINTRLYCPLLLKNNAEDELGMFYAILFTIEWMNLVR